MKRLSRREPVKFCLGWDPEFAHRGNQYFTQGGNQYLAQGGNQYFTQGGNQYFTQEGTSILLRMGTSTVIFAQEGTSILLNSVSISSRPLHGGGTVPDSLQRRSKVAWNLPDTPAAGKSVFSFVYNF